MIIPDKVMRYVIFKKRTVNEVFKKCKQLKYDEEYINQIIEYLKEAEYLNDKIYVEKYFQNIIKLKHQSANEIKIDLMRRGISQDLIEDLIYREDVRNFEEESAIYLLNKKIKSGEEIEKIKHFLKNKGYEYDSIIKAIDNSEYIEDN